MAEIEFTKLSSKGQVVIPRRIRRFLKLMEGTLFVVNEQNGTILLKRIEVPEIKGHEILDIGKIKDKITTILKKNHVTKAGIFGSYSRGEQKTDSDIDILVEISKPISLLDFSRLKLDLEDALGRKVDIVEYNSIKPLIKKRILNEEVRII
ncbi:MAG TPA: nucleotidyltransferase domain-containing protein [Candidatus Nanoarchaeia archaeon]|nr:nucleotidyltransferase domain-containing protein [Candidatus Nanoarchaeia archaeon]